MNIIKNGNTIIINADYGEYFSIEMGKPNRVEINQLGTVRYYIGDREELPRVRWLTYETGYRQLGRPHDTLTLGELQELWDDFQALKVTRSNNAMAEWLARRK